MSGSRPSSSSNRSRLIINWEDQPQEEGKLQNTKPTPNSEKSQHSNGSLWQSATSFYNFQSINEKKQGIEENTPQLGFNRITLMYNVPELEASFIDDFGRSSLWKVRLGLLLVVAFELFVGLLDILKLGVLGER